MKKLIGVLLFWGCLVLGCPEPDLHSAVESFIEMGSAKIEDEKLIVNSNKLALFAMLTHEKDGESSLEEYVVELGMVFALYAYFHDLELVSVEK